MIVDWDTFVIEVIGIVEQIPIVREGILRKINKMYMLMIVS